MFLCILNPEVYSCSVRFKSSICGRICMNLWNTVKGWFSKSPKEWELATSEARVLLEPLILECFGESREVSPVYRTNINGAPFTDDGCEIFLLENNDEWRFLQFIADKIDAKTFCTNASRKTGELGEWVVWKPLVDKDGKGVYYKFVCVEGVGYATFGHDGSILYDGTLLRLIERSV